LLDKSPIHLATLSTHSRKKALVPVISLETASVRLAKAITAQFVRQPQEHCDVDRADLHVIQRHTSTRSDRGTGFGDATQELWMMLQPVLEPVLVRRESDQYPGRSAMTRNDDFLHLGES